MKRCPREGRKMRQRTGGHPLGDQRATAAGWLPAAGAAQLATGYGAAVIVRRGGCTPTLSD